MTNNNIVPNVFKSWLLSNPLILDTETTGLGSDAEIVEISMVDAQGKIVMDTLVKPSKPIPADATRIHGITNEMVANSPTWPELYDEFAQLVKDRMVIIYNADYDVRIIDQTCKAYSLE